MLGSSLRTTTLGLLLLLAVFSVPMAAQFNASLQGTVTDPSGAVVPNANVSVTNQATGIDKTVTTSSSGFYRMSELPPGTYTVAISASGFDDPPRETMPQEVGNFGL